MNIFVGEYFSGVNIFQWWTFEFRTVEHCLVSLGKYFYSNIFGTTKSECFKVLKKILIQKFFWLYMCFVKPRRKNIWLGNGLRTDLSFEKELWGSVSVTDEYGKNISCFIHCLQISISLHINDMVIEDSHKNRTNLEQMFHHLQPYMRVMRLLRMDYSSFPRYHHHHYHYCDNNIMIMIAILSSQWSWWSWWWSLWQ